LRGYEMFKRTREPPDDHQPNRYVESNRIEGAAVYDRHKHRIGTIKRLVLEKESGRAVYAIMSFGGFLGVHRRSHMIPWEQLHYRKALKGYAIPLTAADLSGSPVLLGDEDLWPDHRHQKAADDFWSPQQWGY
jgi:hypothetical protein